ncbi:MAG: peptidoglycan bridge formation glycyltransferase FemA/FemB family protein [Candidatus Saccharibacteria bacterium]|nr:peptidoglycan bridge formation glycyltransferase FemA/FemB family protein [Candidatus Saccharibacteria bacterium]
MNPHFLQTEAWEAFQKAEGNEIFRKKEKNFEFMAILKPTPLGNYLFVPYGPTLADKKALKPAISALKSLAKEKNCVFVRIEPIIPFSQQEMKKIGAKKTHHFDPEHTLILELPKTDAEIYEIIGKNKARAHKNHKIKEISLRTSKNPSDMEIFFKFYEDVAKNDNFQTNERDYLKNQLKFDFATLYIAEFQKKPIGATIMYTGKDTCYYAYAGADYEFRKKEAGAILLTQMLLDARVTGKKFFDFWGITLSEDPKHPWYGFTKFKKSFGGKIVSYAGTYDIPIKRIKYTSYSLLRPINKLKRKIIKK